MRRNGFPPVVAVTMTAIALRESAGDPSAFNGNTATGDRSYGLVQINMRDAGIAALLKEKIPAVAADEKALLNPDTNAQAAFILWNGHNANLDVAWYISKAVYQERYAVHLPAAQSAALQSKMGI